MAIVIYVLLYVVVCLLDIIELLLLEIVIIYRCMIIVVILYLYVLILRILRILGCLGALSLTSYWRATVLVFSSHLRAEIRALRGRTEDLVVGNEEVVEVIRLI